MLGKKAKEFRGHGKKGKKDVGGMCAHRQQPSTSLKGKGGQDLKEGGGLDRERPAALKRVTLLHAKVSHILERVLGI